MNLNTNTIKYRVVVNGSILNESPTELLAEAYLTTLDEKDRSVAVIIPVTADGKQILNG